MEIRRGYKTDIPGMIALLYQVGEIHHVIRPDIFRSRALKYDENALKALLEDENRPIFVAVENGAVLGYCFCVLKDYRGSGVQTDRVELYIDDLCVDVNCREQGIATSLCRHAIDWAKGLGCGFVTLNVWCGNDGAMAFYEKMGLTPRHVMMELKL